MPLMTKAEYARKRGWSKAYLSKKEVKSKLEPAMAENPDKPGTMLIDSDIADQIFKDTRDPARAPFRKENQKKEPEQDHLAGEIPLGKYEQNRTELQAIKLEQEKLKLAEQKGQLLPRDDTVRAISTAGMVFRDGLKARVRYIAEQVSTMKDVKEIAAFLDKQDRVLMDTMIHELIRRIPSYDEGESRPTVN